MKRIFLTLTALLALVGAGSAQVSDVTLGYCAGELPAKGDISYSEADSYVSAAIYIPAGTINTYAGNEITGVRAGLASKLNIDELTVWLRTSLDGANLAEATIDGGTSQTIVKGWNELYFASPYAIEAGSSTGIYIGYTFHQKGSAFGVAAVDTPYDNAFWVKFGEQDWEDRSASGSLSIEGLVRGESLPRINLSLTSVSTPDVYIIDRGTIDVAGTVKNIATHTVTAFDVVAQVDGKTTGTVRVEGPVAYNETLDFNVTLPLGITELGDGTGKVTVTVDNLAEGDDEDMADNSVERTFSIVEHDFTRRVLVEEFTTEKCPNCPRVGGYIHDALEKDEFSGNVLVVCHHAGYYTDWLTTSFDSKYLWLFNQGGQTYAPAITADRKVVEDDSPVTCPSSQSEMESLWEKCLAEPAFVSLDISAEYIEDGNKLAVNVTGSKSIPELCDNPTLTVFIVEDDITAQSQAGASGEYIHYHVNRAVNTAWGDPVNFDGDDYNYSCEFALSNLWNWKNLQVVAFIANYNSEDATDCEVQNANALGLAEILPETPENSSVVSIEADAQTGEAVVYTLQGTRVGDAAGLAPGVYIRRSGSSAEKFIVR